MSRVATQVSARLSLIASVAALAATTLGCATAPLPPVKEGKKCEVQVVSLSVIAAPVINPTLEGEPRPVQMRIYQLKDDVRLQSATFEQVWKDDAAALPNDILKRDDIFVYPNTRTDVKFDRDPAAQQVVGAALFRNPKGRSWFVSFELPPAPGKGDCTVPGCEDGKCGVNANPSYALWVDATRVDDGADHKDDVSDGRRIRVIQLSKPVPGPGPGAPPPPSPPVKN